MSPDTRNTRFGFDPARCTTPQPTNERHPPGPVDGQIDALADAEAWIPALTGADTPVPPSDTEK